MLALFCVFSSKPQTKGNNLEQKNPRDNSLYSTTTKNVENM